MTTVQINQEKLAKLDELMLDHGSHRDFDDGHCAMEVVAWLADEGHTDAPSCASPVLRRYLIALNDRWDGEKRQLLKPYLIRTIGTGGDGKDGLREKIAAEWATKTLLGPWLRLAGLNDHADALAAVDTTDKKEVRRLILRASDAAWALRSKRRDVIYRTVKAKVLEELAKKPAAAAAAAAAADAVADAVAAAVADAVADAAADAAAAAAAAAPDPWGHTYSVAYKAAKDYYAANPLQISDQIVEIAANQKGAALELLELLIDPTEAKA